MPVMPRSLRVRRPRQRQRSIPLPYQETSPEALWDNYEPGAEITPSGILQDAVDSLSYDPTEVLPNFASRMRKYLTRGPDINQRVPRSERRYIAKI